MSRNERILLCLGTGVLALGGCRVSPQAIERRHWELNDSIRQTSTEELLLNIVRLRYDEMPYFLQVSSVSTQFSATRGVQVSATEPANAWMKVKYHGYWFYIAADDMALRESFTLLDAIFASVVGNVPGGKPLLTLPVNQ